MTTCRTLLITVLLATAMPCVAQPIAVPGYGDALWFSADLPEQEALPWAPITVNLTLENRGDATLTVPALRCATPFWPEAPLRLRVLDEAGQPAPHAGTPQGHEPEEFWGERWRGFSAIGFDAPPWPEELRTWTLPPGETALATYNVLERWPIGTPGRCELSAQYEGGHGPVRAEAGRFTVVAPRGVHAEVARELERMVMGGAHFLALRMDCHHNLYLASVHEAAEGSGYAADLAFWALWVKAWHTGGPGGWTGRELVADSPANEVTAFLSKHPDYPLRHQLPALAPYARYVWAREMYDPAYERSMARYDEARAELLAVVATLKDWRVRDEILYDVSTLGASIDNPPE